MFRIEGNILKGIIYDEYSMAPTSIVIPNFIIKIDKYAFTSCVELLKVTFEENSHLQIIEEGAFSECPYLKSITLPPSVKILGNKCFYKCKSLTYVYIPLHIKYIPDSCFGECDSLNDIQFSNPNNIFKIERNAFYWCTKLYKVPIFKNLRYIGDNAFNSVFKLKEFILSSKIQYIGNGAFENTSITKIQFIQKRCYHHRKLIVKGTPFLNCKLQNYDNNGFIIYKHILFSYDYSMNLQCIIIPKNTTHILNNIFYYNTDLTEVSLPNTLTYIGNTAFYGCKNLRTINFPNTLTHIGNECFNKCESLTTVNLSMCKHISILHKEIFADCKSLKSILLPDTIKIIGNFAFKSCNCLQYISPLPYLTHIGRGAFYNDFNLKSFFFSNTLTYTGHDSFMGCCKLKYIKLVEIASKEYISKCTSLERLDIESALQPTKNLFIRIGTDSCDAIKEIWWNGNLLKEFWILKNEYTSNNLTSRLHNNFNYAIYSGTTIYDTKLNEKNIKILQIWLKQQSLKNILECK